MRLLIAARLALAAVRRHRGRTLLAISGVAVAAAMLLDMVMLSSGMQESFRTLLAGGGFELRLTPRGTLPFDTDATVADAARVMARVRGLPEVEVVAPVLGASLHVRRPDGTTASAFGLGVDPTVQGDYTLEEGTDLGTPGGLVVNRTLLAQLGARPGDTLDVAAGYDPQLRTDAGRRRLVLQGVVRFRYLGADQPAAALPIGTLQAMRGADGFDRASLVMVRLRTGVPADSVGRMIEHLVPTVTAISVDEAIRLTEERLSYFRQLAVILGTVSFLVAFLLVTTLVTVSVGERVGEIAALRALGVSRARVVQQVALEGLLLTSAGAVAGLFLGLATGRWLNTILLAFPGLSADIDFFLFRPAAAAKSLGVLVICGLLAGVYPAWRAASLPIAAALREEQAG